MGDTNAKTYIYTSICVLYSIYVLVSMYKHYKKSNISGIVFWGFILVFIQLILILSRMPW